MNSNLTPNGKKENTTAGFAMDWKVVVRFGAYMLLLPCILFLAAGRLDWVMGWAYVAVGIASTAISRAIAAMKFPELLAERGRSLDATDAKAWDRVIVRLVALYGPLAILITAGLDKRFAWSPSIALWVQLVALLVVVLGALVGTWAMAVNQFFSAIVRIQKERGHTVVTDGPYQFVRHPAYLGGIVADLAAPIMLGSLWALIPAGLVVVGLVVRTALEDRTLRQELQGYAEYALQTPYRLFPGIW